METDLKLSHENAEIFVPDGSSIEDALSRTTHLAVGAHHDDLEIMAVDGILRCFKNPNQHFTGVIVTDGKGSPRADLYANYSNSEMGQVRIEEQKNAAKIGDFSAVAFMGYSSKEFKDKGNLNQQIDFKKLIEYSSPDIVYTHNLADKHPTHVAVAVKLIKAIRNMPQNLRPKKLYGCEVWRDLGWMMDEEKVVFNTSERQNLQMALFGVFDSQISGGKRYDLAAMGRRIANAIFFASHTTDKATGLSFAMDLTPLIENDTLDIEDFTLSHIEKFSNDVKKIINQFDY